MTSPNSKAGEHKCKLQDHGKRESSQNKSDSNPLLVTDNLKELSESFGTYWDVKLKWGMSLKFPYGTYVMEIVSKGRKSTSKSFLHHELDNNQKRFSTVLDDLQSFGLYIDQAMLEKMIKYATELRKQDCAEEISSETMSAMLGGAYGKSDARRTHEILEEDLLFDIEELAFLSEHNYNPFIHKGIVLDANEYKGKGLVAVTRFTLMDRFVWDEIDDRRVARGEYKSTAQCKELNEVLQGWESCDYLMRFTQGNHKGERVKGIPVEYKTERFYIVKCPKVYEALTNGEGGGRNA